jgi:hypothetical protein
MDLERYVPEDPECFGIYVEASIGPQGLPGEDLFGFMVCTPRWLDSHPAEKGFLLARDHLILWRYDYSLLWRAIADLCRRTEGPDWESVANRLSQYAHWEFEDPSFDEAKKAFRRFLERHGVDVVRYRQREQEEMARMVKELGGPEKFTAKEASEIRDKLFEEFGLPRG